MDKKLFSNYKYTQKSLLLNSDKSELKNVDKLFITLNYRSSPWDSKRDLQKSRKQNE